MRSCVYKRSCSRRLTWNSSQGKREPSRAPCASLRARSVHGLIAAEHFWPDSRHAAAELAAAATLRAAAGRRASARRIVARRRAARAVVAIRCRTRASSAARAAIQDVVVWVDAEPVAALKAHAPVVGLARGSAAHCARAAAAPGARTPPSRGRATAARTSAGAARTAGVGTAGQGGAPVR
jgi:hypothetical protein